VHLYGVRDRKSVDSSDLHCYQINQTTTFKSYHRLFILMNQIILVTSTLALFFGLIFSVSVSPNVGQVHGQQNQTDNATSTQKAQQGQQNQTTEVGSASEIENMTAGNIPVVGNETDIQSQSKNDTSITEGLQKEQLTTDTNMTDK
jgi:hypothetical protein